MMLSILPNWERTALVVDDDRAIRQLLADLLQAAGFATISLGQGRPAIEVLEQHCFDLLVADIRLPDMNGLEICEVARERYGDATVVVMITADNRIEQEITALDLGADDFLDKPFNPDELMARINAKLRRVGENGCHRRLIEPPPSGDFYREDGNMAPARDTRREAGTQSQGSSRTG